MTMSTSCWRQLSFLLHFVLIWPGKCAVSYVTDVITQSGGSKANRAFAVSAPSAWNSLPIDIRDCSSEATFKKHIKTFLFHVAFN